MNEKRNHLTSFSLFLAGVTGFLFSLLSFWLSNWVFCNFCAVILIAWEKNRHLATPPLVSPRNDVSGTIAAIDLFHDTRHLFTHLTAELMGYEQYHVVSEEANKTVINMPMEEIAVEFVILENRKWRPFHLKDDNVKIWVEVIIVTFLYAVATVNVLMANSNRLTLGP